MAALTGISLAMLVLVFGAYALADGILAIITALRRRGTHDRWWLLLREEPGNIGPAGFRPLWAISP